MPSTYSPLLRLELIGAGEQSGLWGDTTNKNVGQLLEQAIAGVTTVSLSGGAGDYTLSALDGTFDESRSAVLKFIGNPSGIKNIIIPTETKLYVVRNDCGQTITVKTSAQVTGVTLLNGEASLVFCDGTNAVAGIATAGVGPTTVANGGTGATSFTGGFVKSPGGTGTLTSSATVNAATELTGTVPLANGGTGVASFTAGALVVGNGSSPLAVLTGGASGQVATWNGSSWTAATPAVGAVSSVFGRSGAVTAQSGDYSSFYPSLTGSGANGTWGINISGSAAQLGGVAASGYVTTSSLSSTLTGYLTTSGTAFNSSRLNGLDSSYWARKDQANTFSSTNTFSAGGSIVLGSSSSSGSGTITSTAYNMTAFTSMYTASNNIFWSIGTSGINNVMTLGSTGNLNIAGTLTQGSDPRLKDDIEDYTKGLETLKNIRVRSWTYNGKGDTVKGRKAIGVVATEIEAYMPEMIINAEGKLNPEDVETTTIKNVDSLQMTWLLVKSVQELKTEIDSLKAQLAAK